MSSIFGAGTDEVEDFLKAIPQIGVGVAGIIGITIAVMRQLRAGKEYENVIDTLREERDYWKEEAFRERDDLA